MGVWRLTYLSFVDAALLFILSSQKARQQSNRSNRVRYRDKKEDGTKSVNGVPTPASAAFPPEDSTSSKLEHFGATPARQTGSTTSLPPGSRSPGFGGGHAEQGAASSMGCCFFDQRRSSLSSSLLGLFTGRNGSLRRSPRQRRSRTPDVDSAKRARATSFDPRAGDPDAKRPGEDAAIREKGVEPVSEDEPWRRDPLEKYRRWVAGDGGTLHEGV